MGGGGPPPPLWLAARLPGLLRARVSGSLSLVRSLELALGLLGLGFLPPVCFSLSVSSGGFLSLDCVSDAECSLRYSQPRQWLPEGNCTTIGASVWERSRPFTQSIFMECLLGANYGWP